jgi:hypothetical protein
MKMWFSMGTAIAITRALRNPLTTMRSLTRAPPYRARYKPDPPDRPCYSGGAA